jgi:hypothetical protein
VLNDKQETVGKVVRYAGAPNGGYDLLIEARLESVTAGALSIGNTALEIQALPYAL